MGKVLIDLDAQFFSKEKSFLFLYSTGKYEEAYQILKAMNCSLPSDARIVESGVGIPELRMQGNSLRAEMEYDGYVKGMVDKYYSLVQLSASTYRENMIEDLNR